MRDRGNTLNDFRRADAKSVRQYEDYSSTQKSLYSKVYIGIVKENRDVQRMGRLKVYIPELCGTPDDNTKWITVQYVSPFAGSSPINRNRADGQEITQTQVSYGMWFIPPDLENEVVVMFINGQPNKGIYIGNLFQYNMNNMVPAIGSSPSPQDGVKLDGLEINPPAGEYNKRDVAQDSTNPQRPRQESLHQGLYNQGLYGDADRGPSNASARREAPSQIFGFNTPRGHSLYVDDGEIEIDPTTGEGLYNDNQIVKKSLTNEYIRLRTRGGTQIIVNDTLGYVYINSKLGNSWFELSDEGISLYTAKNFNLRCQGDMNVRVDGNLNQEIIGATQWRNGGNFTGLYESDMNLSIIPGGASAGGNNELRLNTKGEIFINSDDSITLDARNQIINKTNRIINAANRIDKNSFNISGGKAAAGPESGATRDRQLAGPGYPEGEVRGGGGSILPARGLVTHEPWNYHQRLGTPNTSENSIGNVRRECPPAETLPNPNESNANAATRAGNTPGSPQETTSTVPPASDPRVKAPLPGSKEKESNPSTIEAQNTQDESEIRVLNRQARQRAADGARREEAARAAGNTAEAEKIRRETDAAISAPISRVQDLRKQVDARSSQATASSNVVQTGGRIDQGTTRNPNSVTGPISSIIQDGQSRAANIVDDFTQNAARLSGRLTEVGAQILSPVTNATRTAFNTASTTVTNIGSRVLDPGIRTFDNIVPNYTQDLERAIIQLKNGAIIKDALKPVSNLSVSNGMLNSIRAEYPFRETVAAIKETGTQIIGYGTQLTENLAERFISGIPISIAEAENLFKGRIGEVENTIRNLVNVPMTQNQFDAVVSLGEHIGPEALAESDLIPAINSGNVQAAINDFECYTNGGELGARRRAEAGTYANGGPGDPSNNSEPGFTPEPVAGSGKLTKGRPTQEQIDAIDRAVERTGVSREALFGFAAQESAFNDSVKAGTSSATGLMQFTNGTWNDMVRKYGTEYGLTPNGRNDPNQSAMAAALYMKENQRILERQIGRPVTTTDLYAAHFLGPGGAPNLLKAPGNAIAANVAKPGQVSANRSVFYDKSGKPRTVNEVYKFMQQKVEAPGITYSQAFPRTGSA